MKLETQVVSLEISKKLRELGVEQESLFSYYGNAGIWHEEAIVDMAMYKDADEEFKKYKLLPAYTVAELGEILEKTNYKNISDAYHFLHKRNDVDKFDLIEHMKKPDFGAKMLIYLLENNLITL